MRKYPYFGVNNSGMIVLFSGPRKGVRIQDHMYLDNWIEFLFSDCTVNHLNGNCCEIVSQEHFEFIKKMVNNAGSVYDPYYKYQKGHYAIFDVDRGVLTTRFCSNDTQYPVIKIFAGYDLSSGPDETPQPTCNIGDTVVLVSGEGNAHRHGKGVLVALTNDYIILRVGEKQEQHFHRDIWRISSFEPAEKRYWKEGEPLEVGMWFFSPLTDHEAECIFTDKDDIIYRHQGHLCRVKITEVKPIDTRTDKEKAVDNIVSSFTSRQLNSSDKDLLLFAYDKWVGGSDD